MNLTESSIHSAREISCAWAEWIDGKAVKIAQSSKFLIEN
jgi:hypothetical protein